MPSSATLKPGPSTGADGTGVGVGLDGSGAVGDGVDVTGAIPVGGDCARVSHTPVPTATSAAATTSPMILAVVRWRGSRSRVKSSSGGMAGRHNSRHRSAAFDDSPYEGRLAGMLNVVADHADQAGAQGHRRIPAVVDDAIEVRCSQLSDVRNGLRVHCIEVGQQQLVGPDPDGAHLVGAVPVTGRVRIERQTEALDPAALDPGLLGAMHSRDVIVLDAGEVPDQPADRVGIRVGTIGQLVCGQPPDCDMHEFADSVERVGEDIASGHGGKVSPKPHRPEARRVGDSLPSRSDVARDRVLPLPAELVEVLLAKLDGRITAALSMGFALAQLDPADLARDSLGQVAEFKAPDPLVGENLAPYK